MTRKDTIIIAVLFNTGLLAVLFAGALLMDDESPSTSSPTETPPAAVAEASVPNPQPQVETLHIDPIATSTVPVDEVDTALNQFVSQGIAYQGADQISNPPSEEDEPEVAVTQAPKPIANANLQQYVEVTVKKGDALEKIARTNGTTVAAIKTANNLKSEKLNIGQVLKIPAASGTPKKVIASAETKPSANNNNTAADASGAVYYTIKSGDNPWTIAKQNGVKYDDLLKLNGWNKDNARNLKVGDKVRIK